MGLPPAEASLVHSASALVRQTVMRTSLVTCGVGMAVTPTVTLLVSRWKCSTCGKPDSVVDGERLYRPKRLARSVSEWSIRRLAASSRDGRDTSASPTPEAPPSRSEEHTSELQSRRELVCRLLLEKKKKKQ